ncbi:MAG: class I SAM-dependent methyltransferase [Candidatus Competibacter sp.]|nr:class I SAM-dependent methyltransferase [Candidatus Competibacter sp.]
MKTIKERVCPACGVFTAHDTILHKNGCDILRCRKCGLGRAEAPDFKPRDYYTANYFTGGYADGYADYLGAEPVLRREFRGTLSLLRRYVPNGRLLDVGCAYGFFLQEAKSHFQVSGIEIVAEAAAHARANGLDVVTGTLDASVMQDLGRFDVITMLDVIEHLPAPHDTLSLLSQSLLPGGILVITTGDFGSLSARLSGNSWRLMTPPQHLWFFTQKSIMMLAEKYGLMVARVEHPWKIVPLSLVVFQLARMIGTELKSLRIAKNVWIPLNLFDAMRVVLVKREFK